MVCSHSPIEKHLHSMGKVLKFRDWISNALSEKNGNQWSPINAGCLLLTSHLLNSGTNFFTKCLQGTKNVAWTRIWSSARDDLTPINKRLRAWNMIFICVKRCFAYVGPRKRLSITSCLIGTKRSTRPLCSTNEMTQYIYRGEKTQSTAWISFAAQKPKTSTHISPIWPTKPPTHIYAMWCHIERTLPISITFKCYALNLCQYGCRIELLDAWSFRVETGQFLLMMSWKSCWTMEVICEQQGGIHKRLTGR